MKRFHPDHSHHTISSSQPLEASQPSSSNSSSKRTRKSNKKIPLSEDSEESEDGESADDNEVQNIISRPPDPPTQKRKVGRPKNSETDDPEFRPPSKKSRKKKGTK